MKIPAHFALATAMASACTLPDNASEVHRQTQAEAKQIAEALSIAHDLRRVSQPYVGADRIDYAATADSVSVQATDTPLLALLRSVAEPNGYTVIAVAGIPDDKRTVHLSDLTFDRTVREIAASAGLAAIINPQRRAIYVAKEATYTYRIPVHLLENVNTDYFVSSNTAAGLSGTSLPGANASGIGAAGPSGAPLGSGTTPLSAIAGASHGANSTGMKVQGRTTGALSSILTALRELAGRQAQVTIIPETGMITVRADGTALQRVTAFMETVTQDAARQVELKVALVEISLDDELSHGIDWTRILSPNGRTLTFGVTGSSVVQNPSASGQVTSATITSVIKALQSRTRTKVVAEPQLWMLNHQAGIVLNATEKPYLGSVATSISSTGSLATTAGTLSYVMDGVSLAFRPNIIDDSHAEMTIIPMLTTATNQQSFAAGPSTILVGYDIPTSSSHLKVLLEAGKTYIIGGSRFTNQYKSASGIPGLFDYTIGQWIAGSEEQKLTRELVLMLHARIAPAPSIDPLIGESL